MLILEATSLKDLNPERTEWGDLYSWLSTAEYAAFDLLDENKALKKENEQLKQQIRKMKFCNHSNCLGCSQRICEVKE